MTRTPPPQCPAPMSFLWELIQTGLRTNTWRLCYISHTGRYSQMTHPSSFPVGTNMGRHLPHPNNGGAFSNFLITFRYCLSLCVCVCVCVCTEVNEELRSNVTGPLPNQSSVTNFSTWSIKKLIRIIIPDVSPGGRCSEETTQIVGVVNY